MVDSLINHHLLITTTHTFNLLNNISIIIINFLIIIIKMFNRVDFLLNRVGILKIDNNILKTLISGHHHHLLKTLISGHPFVKIITFSHPVVPID
jgi:hypothetical protein